MAYKRKTRDIYKIMVHYGQGWEHDCTEFTMREARARVREYRENCPEYPVKIVTGREPVEAAEVRASYAAAARDAQAARVMPALHDEPGAWPDASTPPNWNL